MPWIGHIIYGLCFIIPLFYFTKDDKNKFNYKVAFIFLANNFVGPDAAHIWVGLPFHNLLGFLIFAIPLSLFYSYLIGACTLSERDIICDCGHKMERDLNSAINIMVKFLKSDVLSHQPTLKEESFLRKWNGFSTIHSPKICPPANA